MYIINGIAYAGEQGKPVKVCGVRPLDNHVLWVRFTDGQAKTFDFTPLLETPGFAPLKEADLFRQVYIDYGVVSWNDGDIDISPEYLYEHGTTVQPRKEA